MGKPHLPAKYLVIFALLVANLVVASLSPNLTSSILATVMFCATVAILLPVEPVAMWMLAPCIFLQASVLLSLNAIEGGDYMLEMGRSGYASNAAASYVLYSLVLIAATLITYRHLSARQTKRSIPNLTTSPNADGRLHPIFHTAFVVISTACVLYLLAAGLRTGFPLLTHMDRFVYRRFYADVLTVNLLDLKILPPAALGVAVIGAQCEALKKTYIGIFIAFIVESFLFGDKFFIVIISIIVFLTPIVIRNPEQAVARIIGYLPHMLGGLCCAVVITLVIYSDYGVLSLDAAIERFTARMTGQGQLWFMAVEHSPRLVYFDGAAVAENIASAFSKTPADFMFSHRLGPFYFVQEYSPPKIYRSFLHNGGSVTPTMVYEAYGLVLFGYIGLFVQMVLTGVMMAYIFKYFYNSVQNGNPFLMLLPAFVLNQALKFVSQGTLSVLISVPAFKSYAAFLLMELLIRAIASGMAPRAQLRSLRMPGDRTAPALIKAPTKASIE